MSEPGQPRGGPSDRHRPQQAAPAPHPSTPSGVLRHDQLPSRSRSDGRPGEQGSGRDATTAASGGRFHGPSGGPGPTRRNILGGGQNCPATSGGRFLGPLAGQAPMGTAQGGRLPPAARGGRLPDPLGEQGLVTGLQSQEEARLATSGGRLRDASGGQRSLQSGQRSRGRQHGQDVLGAGAGTTSTGGSSLGRVGYGGPPGQGYHPLPQQLTSGHGGLGGRAGEHGSQGMNPGSSGSGFYQGPPRQQQQSDFRPAAQGQHQSLAPAGFFFDNHGNLWPLSAYEQYMPAAFPPPVDIRSMDPPPPPRVPPPHQSTNRRARREPPSLHDRHDRSGNPLPPRKDSNSSKESVESGRVEKLGKDKGGKPRKKVRALGGYTRGTGQQTPLAGNLRARLEAEAERAQAVTLQQQQRQFGVARRAQEAERRRRESGFGNLVYEPEIDPRYQMVPWEGQLPIPVDMRTYWSWNQRPAQSNDFDFGFDFRPAPIFDMGTNSWLPPLQLLPQHHQQSAQTAPQPLPQQHTSWQPPQHPPPFLPIFAPAPPAPSPPSPSIFPTTTPSAPPPPPPSTNQPPFAPTTTPPPRPTRHRRRRSHTPPPGGGNCYVRHHGKRNRESCDHCFEYHRGCEGGAPCDRCRKEKKICTFNFSPYPADLGRWRGWGDGDDWSGPGGHGGGD